MRSPGCEYSSTDARLLLTRLVHCVCTLSIRAIGEVKMVLMLWRAAATGTGTELSGVFTAVSFRTPVTRKSTVGRMVMLPNKAKIKCKQWAENHDAHVPLLLMINVTEMHEAV